MGKSRVSGCCVSLGLHPDWDGAGWCAEVPLVGGLGGEHNKGESWGPFAPCTRVGLGLRVLLHPCASHPCSKRSKEHGVWVGGCVCVCRGWWETPDIQKLEQPQAAVTLATVSQDLNVIIPQT